MIILPKQKALFIHVPKTGGDSISKFLLENIDGAHHSGGGKHWAPWMYSGPYRGWFKFGFVREPISWYRSYYSFIVRKYIVPHGTYPVFEAGKYHPMRRWERYDFSSFDTMVESVYKDEPSYYSRLIDWMLGPSGSRMVNFIGKQENLSKDLEIVLDQIGCFNAADRCKDMPFINTSRSHEVDIHENTEVTIRQQESSIYKRFNYR